MRLGQFTLALVVATSLAAGSLLTLGGSNVYRDFAHPVAGAAVGAVGASVSPDGTLAITTTAIPNLVKAASPAVVQITASITTQTPSPFSGINFLCVPGFACPSVPQGPVQQTEQVLGSGFFISNDGYLVTNDHVVNNASNIQVTVTGYNQPFPAQVVGSDYNLDLALLKISAPKPLPYLQLADTSTIQVGQFALAIGNPYGLSHTVTLGIISATGRPMTIGNREYRNLLQTDAAINPGNSGGPLLDLNGNVVGVNTAVNTSGQGLGFAIPASTVNEALPYLRVGKVVPYPWMGIGVSSLPQASSSNNSGGNSTSQPPADQGGLLVTSIYTGGPSYAAGLQTGDILLQFGGTTLYNSDELINLVNKTPVGTKVPVKIWRSGQYLTLTVQIAQMPENLNLGQSAG